MSFQALHEDLLAQARTMQARIATLEASITTLERERVDLLKRNEFLRRQLEDARAQSAKPLVEIDEEGNLRP